MSCAGERVLYATVVAVKKTDFDEKLKKKHVVLIHPSEMRRSKFRNGGPVLIHGENNESVCRSWACTAVEVGCIAFSSGSGVKWNSGDKVALHCYNAACDMIAKLHLFSEKVEKYMLCEDFKAALLRKLDHTFTRVGAPLSINYIGTTCEFTVTRIVGLLENHALKTEMISCFISHGSKSTSGHISNNLDCDPELNQLESKLSNISLKDESSGGGRGTICCLMHHNPLHDDCQCKMNNYFMIAPVPKVYIETSSKHEEKHYVTFDNIGGIRKQLHVTKMVMKDLLVRHQTHNHDTLYTGVLLSGPSGTGKTLVAQAVANEYEVCDVAFITLKQSELSGSQCDVNIATLKRKMDEAMNSSPSVLFIDDIDQIFPKDDDNSTTSRQSRRLTAEFADMIDDAVSHPYYAVLILAATNSPENVSPVLTKLRRIDKEIKFELPNSEARHEILKMILSTMKHNLTEEQMRSVADSTEQYTGADLSDVCRKALEYASTKYFETSNEATSNKQSFLTYCDVVTTLKEVKPSYSKELISSIPKVQWSDIAGMNDIQEEIKDHFSLILNYADAWKKVGISPPHGFLMYGPPGCAKTMIAMAVANEIKANFIPIKGPELLNKYVGESEKAVHNLFLRARHAAPCIIYFDEIDSIAIKRRSHDAPSKVDERVLAQLLVEMSGIDELEGVIVVASTNKPHMMDSALLRSGRFDVKMYVPLPNAFTREGILLMKFKGIPEEKIDVQNLVQRTEGYSCAEVVALCDKAIQESIVGEISSGKTLAFMLVFHDLLNSNPPKTSKKLLAVYEKFRNPR